MANADRSPAELVHAARGGDRAALARVLSLVERGGPAAREVAQAAHPLGGDAYTVGLTGSPGAGKSTLTSALTGVVREAGHDVGVLAIDPSSPFTGGAILGDRVRMAEHALDPGVYIRSMATRGHLGGLSLATPEAVRVLDAVGRDVVLLETVGVGQVEVEVAGTADTTVVVVTPGWGDSVQASKAGLLEIADVLVVNKSDRPGTAQARTDLEHAVGMSSGTPTAGTGISAAGEAQRWRPPVIATVATTGEGVAELWSAVGEHRCWLETSGELGRRRTRRLRQELRQIVVARLRARAERLGGGDDFEVALADVLARRMDPWSAADRLLETHPIA